MGISLTDPPHAGKRQTGRLTIGRLQVYIEPRDIWVGVYVAPNAVYVCPLPLCVLRWERVGRSGT